MSDDSQRILIVKLADIGDAVLALPAVQALRAGYPDARIDVLTTSAGASVFSLSPAIDDIILLAKDRFDRIQGLISPAGLFELTRLATRLRLGRYQTVVILHHLTTQFGARKFRELARACGAPIVAGLDNGRGTFLTNRATDFGFGAVPEWQYGLNVVETLGIDANDSRPDLAIPPGAQRTAQQLLNAAGIDDDYLILHTEVGDYSPARAWPDEHFARIIQSLTREYSLPVVLVGIQPDRRGLEQITAISGVVNLVGRTSFETLCALVSRAALVIGADSSVAHLAGAFDRPSVSLFGPTNVRAWKPYGSTEQTAGSDSEATLVPHSTALHLNLPCSPCAYVGFRLGRPQGCRSRACMTDLSPGDVISAVRGIRNSQAG